MLGIVLVCGGENGQGENLPSWPWKGKWLGHPDMDGWASRSQPLSLWTRPRDVLRSSTGETPVELVVPCEERRLRVQRPGFLHTIGNIPSWAPVRPCSLSISPMSCER